MARDLVFWNQPFFLLICSCFNAIAFGQTCASQMICRDCIRTTGCVWCADQNFVGMRCQNGSSILGCNMMQGPSGFIGETTTADAPNNPVSIRNISLNLRVGEPLTFTVNVTTLRNLPLDLYILMDLSGSMTDELDAVKAIAAQITDRINATTTNVRLGFGSFSDKVTRPFTHDTCGSQRREDCSLYAFRHQIDLTSDTVAFNDAVQAVTTTLNVDSPENGLEALAQVVSCEDIIGWRSRDATGMERGLNRIVLFFTDDQFHYSGEGRLAGILRPYDGQCYLMRDENTTLPINYLRWDEFDYPSVGQIISLLTQFEVATVFAVSENALPTYQVLPTYQNLQDLANQQYSTRTAILTSNTEQILSLIEREYRAILQDVRLLPVATTDADLDFSIQAICPPFTTQTSVDECTGVPLESLVTFDVTVTLTSCDTFRNRTTPRLVHVNVPGFGGFNITYTGVCSCDCEQNMTTRPETRQANLNNLDVQEPIVRRSPAADEDFFGWATVLHQIQTVGDADDLNTAAGKTRIIVGAPMGTFPGGLPLTDPGQSAESRTGLVYSCPVHPGVCEGVQGDTNITAQDIDANMDPNTEGRLPTNGPVIEGRLFDQAPDAQIISPSLGSRAQFEIKTGQLMGATLYSTGENFVACAPRWTATLFTSVDALPLGACYASGRQLTNFQFLQPCTGRTSSNPSGGSYCMAGISVTRVGNAYAVAAPGYNFLQGAVYYGADNTAIRSGRGESNQPDSSGNLVEIRNQYQGFQTTTGFISQARDLNNNTQLPDHIATVPRYNGTTYRGRVNIVNQQSGLTGPYLDITAEGQQMGEFFGYSVVAADLNGDGFDELVVGAPMYTDIRRAGVEIGRLYVFNNTGGNLSETSMVLEGQVEQGRFGTSVVNLGDIDDDSYEDIAVGAPYADNGNNNQGSVYIYYGRADIAEFAQQTPFEIRAEQIVSNVEGLDELRTFGWSLSGGVDVDNNQYGDLSIGAYESKTVVLLRTLPVASVNVSFDAVPPVDLNVMSCSLGPCFNLTVHAIYTGRGLNGLVINYILSTNTISTVANVQNRLVFDEQNSTQVTRTLNFSSPGTEITDTVTVYARNSLDDILTSYELQIELQNNTRNMRINGNQTLTDLSMFPRLRLTGASTITVHIDGVLVGFEQPSYSVHEDVGQFQVCVVVVRPPQSEPLNQTFSLSVSTSTGTAGNSDFTAIISQDVGPFSNTQRRQCFLVAITNSEMIQENSENFFLNLTTRPGEVLQQVTINLAVAEITIMDSDSLCNAETTEFFSWPETLTGTTWSLRCPSTTTIINRTCTLSGVWESVDPSLCTPFTSINVANITLDNYEEVLTNVSGAVRGAAINEQEQTTDNLAMVAAAFARSAALVNEMTIIPNTTVNDLINTLEGLQQWNEGVLQTNSSNIVRSFEVIVGIFAQQIEDGERFLLTTETILFVAELLSQMELTANGRSFSSSDQTGNTNISALNEDETAAAFLPPSLFQSITYRNSTGIFFAVYETGVFFPITNATELIERTNTTVTTVVGSPVLAATVGPGLNFSELEEPVRILLRLNEQGLIVRREAPQCVSWDFDSQEWTTDGCETDLSEENRGVVTCRCNHLTNFAILVDICARFQKSCRPSGAVQTTLEVVSIVGAVLSLVGIAATIFTLLVFKKLRERHATIFHIQLCIALFCMLITFVCGIDQTSVYGGCVLVSVQIHYFTLVAVMFMGAEAVLMFKKLIIVFGQTTTKFFVAISLICWLVPIIPVVIPMAIDLSDAVSGDLLVRKPTEENNGRGFCFIDDIGVFFGAFLGPIFAILIFNAVIFVMVIRVLIKHTQKTLGRTKEQMTKKTAIRLLISIASVMSLFGLTWLFGALTVTGFGNATASIAFQALFVICNAFQGFFIFLFFCVFNKDARESWLEVLSISCGRYHSKTLNPSQAKYSSSGTQKKVKTSNTGLTDLNLTLATSSKTGYNSTTDDLIEDEKCTDIPLTSVAGQEKEKPSVVTFKDDSEIYETNVDTDKKVDLGSSEVKKKEQALEKSDNSEECASPYQWREDGVELKARVKRFSTKKAYKHHVEIAEVDFLDSDSDGSDDTNA